MIPGNDFGTWQTLTPAGLTQTGRVRRFQNRTVERLGRVAQEHAARTYQQLVSGVEQVYKEGTGELAKSLQYKVDATREGVSVTFSAGARHAIFLTSLAGDQPFNPGGHMISAKKGRELRFFWKNPLQGDPPGVYRFRQVHWRTRARRDVIAEVLSAGAQDFQRAMIAAHDAALLEFMQNELQLETRSARVSVGGRR